jgi:hypothetical protein
MQALAQQMGRFLSWLHQFPVDYATRLGVPRQDVGELLHEVRNDALNDFGAFAMFPLPLLSTDGEPFLSLVSRNLP